MPGSAASKGAWEPKVAENITGFNDATLRWMAQLGVQWVDLQGAEEVDRDKKGWWSLEDIRSVQQRCAQFGLRLACVTVPLAWQMNSMLARAGRDQDIERIERSIAAVGQAGVPVFQWRWSPDFKWGPEAGYKSVPGRGGALYRAFDYDLVKDLPPFEELGAISYAQMWERLLYFAKPLVQAAEKAGVKLALHPKDPPVRVLRGIARLFTTTAEIERFFQTVPSPANGFTFCQGTVAEMGADVLDAIRRLGRQGRIHHVHLRAVRGRVPHYVETFIDEGELDMLAALRAYREVGYTGAIVSDHTPGITGDTRDGKIGRSFSHGYLRALIQAVNAQT
jgi:mannonate dehydratase